MKTILALAIAVSSVAAFAAPQKPAKTHKSVAKHATVKTTTAKTAKKTTAKKAGKTTTKKATAKKK